MANPLYNELNGRRGQQGGQRNFAPALLQYMQGYKGNPLEELQSKLNSGEISQQQYNQLRGAAEGIAQRIMGMLPRR